jgi:quercetin dioxygenase-like cupin family protein
VRPVIPNLYRDLLSKVTADHGGEGDLLVHRAFTRDGRAAVEFIDLVVVPPGASIGRHRHGDDEETYVILRGEARMYWMGAAHDVSTGDVVVNPPSGEHALANESDDDVHLLVFEVTSPARGVGLD